VTEIFKGDGDLRISIRRNALMEKAALLFDTFSVACRSQRWVAGTAADTSAYLSWLTSGRRTGPPAAARSVAAVDAVENGWALY